jgi:hypothetical protein
MFGNVAYSQAPFDSFAGNTFTVDVSEQATAQDAQVTRGLLNLVVDELATASDLVAARLPISVSVITEVATATDSDVATIALISGRISETATGSDATTTNGTLFASRSEQVVSVDLINARPNYLVRRQEDATATDRAVMRSLWEPINDTQDPNWVIIPTTPT